MAAVKSVMRNSNSRIPNQMGHVIAVVDGHRSRRGNVHCKCVLVSVRGD